MKRQGLWGKGRLKQMGKRRLKTKENKSSGKLRTGHWIRGALELLTSVGFSPLLGIPRPPHPSELSPYYPLSPGAIGQIPHPLGWLVPQ